MFYFFDVDLILCINKQLIVKFLLKEMLKKVESIFDECLKQVQSNVDMFVDVMFYYKCVVKDVYEDVEWNFELIKKGDEYFEVLLLEMQWLQQDLVWFVKEVNIDGDVYSNVFNDFGF